MFSHMFLLLLENVFFIQLLVIYFLSCLDIFNDSRGDQRIIVRPLGPDLSGIQFWCTHLMVGHMTSEIEIEFSIFVKRKINLVFYDNKNKNEIFFDRKNK